ncbi:MAG: hypothetical protein R3E39_12360 [Anaerolineae bacterium]
MRLLVTVIFLALFTHQATADEPLQLAYGDTIVASINDATPGGIYQFTGKAGDLVSIDALAISPTLDLSVGILGEMQTNLASQTVSNILTPHDAAVDVLLPEDGRYTILVHSENGTQGDYVLRLGGLATSEGGTLSTQPLTALIATSPALRFQLTPNEQAAIPIVFHSDLYTEFRVQVVDESGSELAQATGSNTVALTAPPYPNPMWLVVTRLSEGPEVSIALQINGNLTEGR